jgi:hypothetical protein
MSFNKIAKESFYIGTHFGIIALLEVSVVLCLCDSSSLGVTTDNVTVLSRNRTFSF